MIRQISNRIWAWRKRCRHFSSKELDRMSFCGVGRIPCKVCGHLTCKNSTLFRQRPPYQALTILLCLFLLPTIVNANYAEDKVLIVRIVYAESANQPQPGKELVACVVLNRVDKRGFPKTIRDVVYQKNAFSCVSGKSQLWEESADPSSLKSRKLTTWNRCKDAVIAAMQDRQNSDVIAYRTTDAAEKGQGDKFFKQLLEVCQVGSHIFYKARSDNE